MDAFPLFCSLKRYILLIKIRYYRIIIHFPHEIFILARRAKGALLVEGGGFARRGRGVPSTSKDIETLNDGLWWLLKLCFCSICAKFPFGFGVSCVFCFTYFLVFLLLVFCLL